MLKALLHDLSQACVKLWFVMYIKHVVLWFVTGMSKSFLPALVEKTMLYGLSSACTGILVICFTKWFVTSVC